MRTRTHLSKITVALAAAAFAVAPSALANVGAEPSFDGRSPDTHAAALTAHQHLAAPADWRSPDTRDTAQATQPASADAVLIAPGRSPDTVDAAIPTQAPTITVTQSPGFQWNDFAIGAAAAFIAMLILVLSTKLLAGRQNRKQPNPVATA